MGEAKRRRLSAVDTPERSVSYLVKRPRVRLWPQIGLQQDRQSGKLVLFLGAKGQMQACTLLDVNDALALHDALSDHIQQMKAGQSRIVQPGGLVHV